MKRNIRNVPKKEEVCNAVVEALEDHVMQKNEGLLKFKEIRKRVSKKLGREVPYKELHVALAFLQEDGIIDHYPKLKAYILKEMVKVYKEKLRKEKKEG